VLAVAHANGFEILRQLGEGGMGVVYEALDRRRNARVALKTLQHMSAEALARFKREFRVLQDVHHPNLVSLGDLVVEGNVCFFTMELVEGVDFVSWVRGEAVGRAIDPDPHASLLALAVTAAIPHDEGAPAFDEKRLRDGLAQLVRALDAAHAAGLVHRDVKPDNVRVTADGRVVLLDFGLVLEVADPGSVANTVAGTPAYMAPEQAASGALGPPADWYSVGALLYEALTGAVPFGGKPLEIMLEKQRREPDPPRTLSKSVPRDLDELCTALLHFDPASRPKPGAILRALGAKAEALASVSQTFASPFVGRSTELALLRRAFHDARSKAVAVILEGESGVGKSCLVRHFVETLALESPDLVVLQGRCYERESVPYKGFDGIVDALAQFLARQAPSAAAAFTPVKPAPLLQVFPVLRRVKALAEAEARRVTAIDPVEIRSQAFAALRDILTRIGDRRPLVLVIDDVQWADADSLLLIAQTLRGPDPPPLLLAATRRADAVAPLPSIAGDVRTIRLDRLSDSESCELASRLARRAPSDTAFDPVAIAREAEGHPLFIDALVRFGATLDGASVRLEDALRARVERLDEGSRRVAALIAVAGAPIAPAVVRSAAELEADAMARAIALLRVANLVKTAGPTLARLEPYHDRVRDAVLATLGPDEQRALHRALAVALETEQADDAEALAFHWRAAGDDRRAARWALDAADQAAATLGFDRAAKLYDLALGLVPRPDEEQRPIQIKLGDALANAGRGALAAQVYADAAETANAAMALDLRRRAADQLLRSGLFDEGLAAIRTVLAATGARLHATPLRALFAVVVLRLYLRVRGLGFVRRDPSQVSQQDLTRVDIYWSVSFGLALVDNIRGAAFGLRHLIEALRVGEPYRVARALATEVAYLGRSGAPTWPQTVALIARVRELAESTGDPHAIGWALGTAGLAHHLNGDFEGALALLVKGERVLRDECVGAAWEVDGARTFALSAMVQLGRFRELCGLQPAYLKEAFERGDRFAAVNLRIGYANFAWLVADDPERASREATEAMREWSQAAFHVEHYYALLALTNADLYAGRAAAAHARVLRTWPDLRRSMSLTVHAVAINSLWARARTAIALAESDESQRASLLESARRDARRLERYRAGYAIGFARSLLAGASRVAGRDADAVRLLREAIARFDAAKMRPHAEASRACLGATLGDAEGRAIVAAAEGWFVTETVVAPQKLIAALVPGFRAPRLSGGSGKGKPSVFPTGDRLPR
jgi:serine/threonine protein kinase